MPKSTQRKSRKYSKAVKEDFGKDINAKSAHKAVKKQDKDAENVLCKQDLIIISQGPFRTKYNINHIIIY